jgi:hypothetical protein
MGKADEYRRLAACSLELASKTTNPRDKARLLTMAEAWLDLADRLWRPRNRCVRISNEDPRIQAAFGTRQFGTD